MSNVKPAPLPLTPDLVAKLAGDRPAFGKGIARLPIEGIVNGPADPELPLADCGPLAPAKSEKADG